MTKRIDGPALVSLQQDSPDYKYACECACEVGTTPEVVEEASRAWAIDTGWHERRKKKQAEHPFFGKKVQEQGLVFRLYRSVWFTWVWNYTYYCPDVFVRTQAVDSKTRATFRLVVPDWRWSSKAGALRTCERFARGVCSDLASRNIAVSPPDLARAAQNRSRLKVFARWRSRVQWALAIMMAAAFVGFFATWGVRGGTGYPPTGGVVVLAWALIADLDIPRERLAGRTVWYAVIPAIFGTVVAVFLMFVSIELLSVR